MATIGSSSRAPPTSNSSIAGVGSSSSGSSSSISANGAHAASGGNVIPVLTVANPNAIQVSEKQRGNPLLRSVRLCPWEYNKDIVPDYVMGTTCAIFISLKFHILHPKHVEMRIREVEKMYKLRVLLTLIDDDNVMSVLNLNKICFSNDFTFIAACSNEECARYLETFKYFENKSTAAIQEKIETEFLPKVTRALTSVRSVNKNDVQTLLDVFGCLGNVCEASEQQLVLCPGLGEKKVKRLYRALHEPFSDAAKSKKLRGDAVDTGLTRSFPDVGLLAKETRGEGSEDEYIGSYGTDQPGPLNILHGTIIADRKSSFQSHICAVSNMEEVNRFRRELLADPIVTGATHNIFAYRLTDRDTGMCFQDSDDDGENAAGGKLVELLRTMGVDGVAVIVTRWFGGILLGPDRFKHICNSARRLLEDNGYGVLRK
jgi:DNA repair protein Rad10